MAGMATEKCADVNGLKYRPQFVLTDLAATFSGRLDKSVDLIVFNPPYVPTDHSEVNSFSRSMKINVIMNIYRQENQGFLQHGLVVDEE